MESDDKQEEELSPPAYLILLNIKTDWDSGAGTSPFAINISCLIKPVFWARSYAEKGI